MRPFYEDMQQTSSHSSAATSPTYSTKVQAVPIRISHFNPNRRVTETKRNYIH